MKKFSTQFKNQSETVRLRATERATLRKDLQSFIQYHPLKNDAKEKTPPLYTIPYLKTTLPFRFIIPGFALLLLTIVPVVAERATPGDRLYAVKISVNEELRGTLLRSDFDALEWETERITRRVAEIQKLDRQGRLTSEREGIAAEALRQHSETAKQAIERIRQEDEEEAMMAEIALDALLDVYAALLDTNIITIATTEVVELGDEDVNQITESPARRQIVEVLQGGRTNADDRQSSNQPSYARLLQRIEQEVASSYQLLNAVSEVASDEELQNVTRRLEDIARRVERATALEAEDKEQEARTLLTETLTSVRKVKAFLTNIEVRNSLDLNILLPIEYTEDELRTQLEDLVQVLRGKASDLAVQVDSVTIPSDVLEKVTTSFSNMETTWEEIDSLIVDGNYSEAGELLSDQDSLLIDIETIIVKYRAIDVGRNDTATSSGEVAEDGGVDVGTSTSEMDEIATSTTQTESSLEATEEVENESGNEDGGVQ